MEAASNQEKTAEIIWTEYDGFFFSGMSIPLWVISFQNVNMKIQN